MKEKNRVRYPFLILSSCGPSETDPISGVKRELRLCCVMQCNFSILCWVKVPVLMIDLICAAAYLASVGACAMWALRVKGKSSTLVSWVQHSDLSPFRDATIVCFPATSWASSSQSPLADLSPSCYLSISKCPRVYLNNPILISGIKYYIYARALLNHVFPIT